MTEDMSPNNNHIQAEILGICGSLTRDPLTRHYVKTGDDGRASSHSFCGLPTDLLLSQEVVELGRPKSSLRCGGCITHPDLAKGTTCRPFFKP